MSDMKATWKLYVLFLIIIVSGSFLALFLTGFISDITDLSEVYFFGGVIVVEILIYTTAWIVLVQGIRRPFFHRSESGKPKSPKKDKATKSSENNDSFTSNITGSLKKTLSYLNKDLKKGRESRKKWNSHEKEIDQILDQSIVGGTGDLLAEEHPSSAGVGSINLNPGSLHSNSETDVAEPHKEIFLEDEQKETLAITDELADVQKIDAPEFSEDEKKDLFSGDVDNDLMASLKTEKTEKKKDTNVSLMRDLKDVKVETPELEKGLESVMITLNKFQ